MVEQTNYGGIVILCTVVQDVGNSGVAAGFAHNSRMQDCILRRCNQDPNSPGGNGIPGSKNLIPSRAVAYSLPVWV